MAWLLTLSVFVIIVLVFVFASRLYLKGLFRSAQRAENTGQFEDAVYFYGEALYHYHPAADICREKIRSLSAAHGPFTFAAHRVALTRRTDQDRDGDLKIFEDVVRVIEQAASGNVEMRHYDV
jgi:hypothetical protein